MSGSNGLRDVARECQRVLAPHGSFWLNLGDSYSTHERFGAPRKSLLLGPERVARALVADGWLLRNKIVWAKTNPLPSPARDRLTTAHEYVYLFVQALQLLLRSRCHPRAAARAADGGRSRITDAGAGAGTAERQPRRVATHDARGPQRPSARQEPVRCLAAGLELLPRRALRHLPGRARAPSDPGGLPADGLHGLRPAVATIDAPVVVVDGQPQARPFVPCGCGAPTRPGLVLDPFGGSGTVAEVARNLGRDWLLIELNPDYAELARTRLGSDGGRTHRPAR